MTDVENQFEAIAEQYGNMEGDTARNSYEFDVNWPSITKFLPEPPASVMDYGCGAGVFSRELAGMGFWVLAADNSKTMVDLTKREAGVDVLEWDYHDQALENSFDAIVAKLVLHFVEDLELFGKATSRQLKPAGRLIISVPHPDKTRKLSPASDGTYNDQISSTGLFVTMIHREQHEYEAAFQKANLKLIATDVPVDAKNPDAPPKRLTMCFEALE